MFRLFDIFYSLFESLLRTIFFIDSSLNIFACSLQERLLFLCVFNPLSNFTNIFCIKMWLFILNFMTFDGVLNRNDQIDALSLYFPALDHQLVFKQIL